MTVSDHVASPGKNEEEQGHCSGRPHAPRDINGGNYQSSLSGMRILMVEDDFFLAFDLQEELLLRGAEVIGPIGDLDRAYNLARTSRQIDAAAMDLNLHGEFTFHLVDELVRREVMVAVTTGYDRRWCQIASAISRVS